ncbi:mod [Symbiodinium sp. CCMP2592]|nr:mod [Symbiodinium sp. CCMP2592]
MANRRNKTRLELTWIGKEDRPRLEPRILLEDPEKSYHASVRRPGDIFDNMLIHGDNLLALKALEIDFAGQIKCVFIDPPYNTGSAFEHYDDGIEHSLWLSLMRERLEILSRLLTADGSIWITIDDTESHYLKVVCDEVFGRTNFIANVVWEKTAGRKNDTYISTAHDHILAYAKDLSVWRKTRNLLPRSDSQLARYQNPDDDPRGPWIQGADSTAKSGSDSLLYEVELPSGRKVRPPKGNYWRFSKTSFDKALAEDRVYFGKNGDSLPIVKKYLSDVQDGLVPRTWWPSSEVNSNQGARRDHLRKLLPDIEPFATPKPEELIRRIVQINTNQGDIVLDSFAGSGTTGAVCHKLGRKWIMVELEDTCDTHILPRLTKVIDGDDHGGISGVKEVVWEEKLTPTKLKNMEPILEALNAAKEKAGGQFASFSTKVESNFLRLYGIIGPEKMPLGGGGFRYYQLAPSLLQKDDYDNWIINKDYNPAMLAEALCKIEGFKYDPSPETYWQQGRSTETDYIYITTQMMTADMLQKLSDEVGPDRSLLIMCKAFRSKREWANLTVKKIPKAVLSKCEWGQDDYSLEIKELPVIEDEPDDTEGNAQVEPKSSGKAKSKRRKAAAVAGGNLFDTDETEDGEDN